MLFVGLGVGAALGSFATAAVLSLRPIMPPAPIVIRPLPPSVERPAPVPVLPDLPAPRPEPRPPREPARPGWGKFACATKPLGAEVIIDGVDTGEKTPISLSKAIDVKAGPHRVLFRLGAKKSGPHAFTVNEGEVSKMTGITIE